MGPRLGPSKRQQKLQAASEGSESDPEDSLGAGPEDSSEPEEGDQASDPDLGASGLAPEDSSSEGSDAGGSGGDSLGGFELDSEGVDGADVEGGPQNGHAGAAEASDSGEEVDPRTLAKYERSRCAWFGSESGCRGKIYRSRTEVRNPGGGLRDPE